MFMYFCCNWANPTEYYQGHTQGGGRAQRRSHGGAVGGGSERIKMAQNGTKRKIHKKLWYSTFHYNL